jgi:hypothetical protein
MILDKNVIDQDMKRGNHDIAPEINSQQGGKP